MSSFIRCRFCHGRGCLACEGERQKWEAAHPLPDKPILKVTYDQLENDPAAQELLMVFHADAMTKAFGPGGRGMEEILENLEATKRRLEWKDDE